MPDSFEYAKNGGRKYLFHNLGGGKFEEVSQKVGIDSHRWALAAVAADLRGTGHPDLFVSNDYGVSELYFNDGKRFREVGQQTGVGFAPKSGMNAAFGDIFNRGEYSVYVSNISEDGILIQGNNLWVPKEGTSGDGLQFENLARDFGVELGGWSFGAQFGDLNNDGTLDLYLTNGYISLDRNRSYWYDFSKVAGGNSTIIGDAKNWPAFEGRSLSGYQSKKLWLNDGAGKFVDVAQSVGVTDTSDGRAVALADLWNRGVLDAVVANQNGPQRTNGLSLNWRAPPATVARLEPKSQFIGVASNRCRKSPEAAASPPRTSGACISAWENFLRLKKLRFAGRPANRKPSTSLRSASC